MTNWNTAPVIDDYNYKHFIDPIVNGVEMKCSRTPRDMSKTPMQGFQAAPLLKLRPFDDKETKERIREREAKKQTNRDFLDYYKVAVKNQIRTNYCWIFAPVELLEASRVFQGQPHVSLSPASAGCKIKNFRNVGGYGLEAIEFLGQEGCAPTKLWPDAEINRAYDNSASDAARKSFKCDEYGQLVTGDLDQLNAWLLLFGPVAVGLNWWGHEVMILDVTLDKRGNYAYLFRNSWGNWGDNGHGVLVPSKARGDYVVVRSSVPSSNYQLVL